MNEKKSNAGRRSKFGERMGDPFPLRLPESWLKLIDRRFKNRSAYIQKLIKKDLFPEEKEIETEGY